MEETKSQTRKEYFPSSSTTIATDELLSKKNLRNIISHFSDTKTSIERCGDFILYVQLPTHDEEWQRQVYEYEKEAGIEQPRERAVEAVSLHEVVRASGPQLSMIVDNGITYPHLPNLGFVHGCRGLPKPITEDQIVDLLDEVFHLVSEYGSLMKAEQSVSL